MKNLSPYLKDVDSLPIEALDLISELPLGSQAQVKNILEACNELETTEKKKN